MIECCDSSFGLVLLQLEDGKVECCVVELPEDVEVPAECALAGSFVFVGDEG